MIKSKIILPFVIYTLVFLSSAVRAQTVTSITPTLNSDDVSSTSNISINFSEAMDNSTITTSTVVVSGSQRGIYTGSFTYGVNSATFNPDSSFFAGEIISVVVTNGVESEASNTPISSPYRTMFTVATTGDGKFSSGEQYTVDGSNFTDWSITADINEDGYVDIITLVPSLNSMSIFTNNGDGTFAGPTNYTTANSFQVEAKDVNQDGSVDLVTSNNNAKMMSVFINNGSGSGTFAAKVDYGNGSSWNGKALTVGDIDNDGDEDVLIDIIASSIDSIQVFLNDGDGTYTVSDGIATTTGFEQIKLWDIDGDEDLDFVGLSAELGQLLTYRNDGTGTFSIHTTHTATSSSYQFTLANFKSASADIEAIITDQSADEIRYLGDGSPWAFGALPSTIMVGDTPVAIASGDLDGDGHIDVVVSNANDTNISILMNNGSPTFTESNYSTGSTYANYILLADVDKDGDLDIVMANQDGTLSILDNFEGTEVVSISPSNGLTDIATNSNITIEFNDAMKEASLNATNITVVGSAAGAISGSYSYNSGDSTLTINPLSDFIIGDEITVTVTTNVTNKGDQAIASSATSTFTVEGVNVQTTSPTINSVGIAANSDIDITFNDSMDNTTLTTSNILVFGSLSGAVAGSISISGNTATFNPTNDFIAGELISVVVTSGVENSSNVAIESSKSWQFSVDGETEFIIEDDSVKTTGTAPNDVAVLDVDLDGNLDLVVTNGSDNTVSVMLNNGSGGYSSTSTIATGTSPTSVATGDFDNQNGMDFVVTNYSENDIRVYLNNGSGNFTTTDYAASSGTVDAVVGDFDGDGYQDIIAHNRNAGNATIFLNDGDGTFTSSGSISTSTNMDRIYAADIDNDKDIDIAVGGAGQAIWTALNNGDGTFAAASFITSLVTWDVEFIDLNSDNYLDLVVSNEGSDEVSIHLNDGDGTFGIATDYSVTSAREISVFDYGNDGDMDLAVANNDDSEVQILLNSGGVFSNGPTFNIGITPEQIAIADLDEDGQLDFVTVNRTSNSLSINYGTEFVEVIAVTPTVNSINIASNANITATFNSDINGSTLDSSTVVVHGSFTGLIEGSITYDSPSKTMTFNPDSSFKVGEEVTMTFTTGIKNMNGASLTSEKYSSFIVEVTGTGVGYFDYTVENNVFANYVSQFVAGDLDNDGDIDLASESNNTMYIRLNSGSGNFGTPTEYYIQSANSIDKGDLDNDGDLDLIVMSGNNKLIFLENNGSGVYSRKDSITTNQYIGEDKWGVVDFDNDGFLDVAFIDESSGSNYAIYVYTNDGSINYSSYLQTNDFSEYSELEIADLNNDGFLDFVLFNRYESFATMLNNGDGTFASEVSYNAPSGSRTFIRSVDLDGDGYLDLAISNFYAESDLEKISVRLNNGDGTFGSATNYSNNFDGFAMSTGDIDGDGDQDIVLYNSSNTAIATNDGDGGITEIVTYSVTSSNSGGVLIDYDGDNDLDIIHPRDNKMSILTNTLPTTPSSSGFGVSFSKNFGNQINANWGSGNGNGRLVIMKQGSAVDAIPSDDVIYTADSFGNGSEIGSGNYVVYAGTSNSAIITGLSTNTQYYIAIYEYNKGGTLVKYLTTTPVTSNVTTGDTPTFEASEITFSEVKHDRFKIDWTNGNGQNRIVIVKEGGVVDGIPTDNTAYSDSSKFGIGAEIGTGNYVVYNGSGNSVTVTELNAEETYHIAIFEYNGADGVGRFKTGSPATGSQLTLPTPTIWSKNDSTLSFTKANFADHTQSSNQDRITDNLWITRGERGYIFNVADEFEADDYSPSGTKWALGTTDNLSTLSFQSFEDLWEGEVSEIPGNEMVIYSEVDNLYFDITFSSWTSGSSNGGGFSYTRAKGPEPTSITKSFQDFAGYALRFDEGNLYEYYTEVYDRDFKFGNEFTIETWVKLDSIGFEQGILSLESSLGIGITSSNKVYAYHVQPEASSGEEGGGEIEGEIEGDPARLIPVLTEYAGPSEKVDLESTDALVKNEWYHIALTGESGGFLKLYVNGVIQDSDSVQNVAVDASYWYFGREYYHYEHLYGTLDEVRIWKDERSASQIRSYMHRPYSGSVGRLYGYWQFNEGTGTSTYDGLNNWEAEFDNQSSSAWISSDAPIGKGTVEEISDFQTGTTSIGNASLSMADGFDNPVDVQVTEVEGEPNQYPSGFTSGLGDKYFIINLFGDPGTFSANLTLTFGDGVITSAQQSNPSQIKLYKRSSNSTGEWIEIANASSANSTTGVVTWTGITSFSQFMAVNDEPSFNIQIADGTDIISYIDSTYTFADSLFDLEDGFADSLLTINAKSTLSGKLYLDQNSNGVFDDGTDSLLTEGKELVYTPSGSVKLRYSSETPGVETGTIKLQHSIGADSVSLNFATVLGNPSIAGNSEENGWYLLTNPQETTLGELLSNVWTQGAVNSNSPSGDATLYTFSQDSSKYVAVTTDLDTTKLSAGQGLLVYLYEDDDLGDGESDVDGGWPKELGNYGEPFGTDVSIAIKNVNHDGVAGTSGSEGFALLGNPFGWPLSADSVIAALKEEDPLANRYVYRWNAVAKTYQILSTGSINPYESVFVRVISSGTTANLNFDYEDGVGVLAKTQIPEMFELNLVHSESERSSTFKLRTTKNAQEGIDPYDGYYLGSYANKYSNLYSIVENQPISLNNIPLGFNGEIKIPLYADATQTGNFELNWDQESIPKEWTITLENNATGEVISMNELNTYLFDITKAEKKKALHPNTLFGLQNNASKTKANNTPVLTLRVSSSLSVGNENELGIPDEVELFQNYPNPFNPSSVIRFGVPSQSKVKLEIFDILGRRVATLINNEVKPAGRYNLTFFGDNLASGIYLYRLSVGNDVIVKKMTLIK